LCREIPPDPGATRPITVERRPDMARTPSTMTDLGTPANHFNLTDVVSGRTVSLSSFAGKQGLLIMFICNHCPFVVHVQDQLAAIGRDYAGKELGIVAIS